MLAATLDYLVDAFALTVAPAPRPRPLLAFASSLRMPDEGGGDPEAAPREPQLHDPRSHPAQYEFYKAFAKGGFLDFVVLGPVQDGKTWAIEIVPTLWNLVELRRHVVYGCPDRPFCGKMWRSKFLPTIHASGLGHLLPETGPGSDGGVPDDMLFGTGARFFMLGAGAKNEAGQAGVTAPTVVIGERSSIRPRWVELLFGRKESYGAAGRGVSTSTLKHDGDGEDSTVTAYNDSTGGRLQFRCPKCSHWQSWEWDRVEADWTSDETAMATVRLHCANSPCRHGLTEYERMSSLRDWRLVMKGQSVGADGVVVGIPPASQVWGLRWTALDSPLKDLRVLAVKYRQAVVVRDVYGEHGKLQQFTRDMLVRQYRGHEEGHEATRAITREYLASRSAAFGWAETFPDRDDGAESNDRILFSRHIADLPTDDDGKQLGEFASLEVDVQDNRCYWSIELADGDLRTWDVAWGYEYGSREHDPMSKGELHAVLDRIRDIAPGYVGKLPIVLKGIDVGFRQDEIVDWLRSNPSWQPVAGAGDEVAGKLRAANASGDLPGVIYRHKPEGWRLPGRKLYTIEVNRVREQAQNAFMRPAGSPGAAHLPKGLKSHDTYIKHLCGERLVEHPKTGRRTWQQTPGQRRHDYLDLRVYHHARIRLHLENARRSAESPADHLPEGSFQAVEPVTAPSGDDFVGGGGDFVGGWGDE